MPSDAIWRESSVVASRWVKVVNGELDDLPEQAFFNVGNADSAREKAKTLTEEEKQEEKKEGES